MYFNLTAPARSHGSPWTIGDAELETGVPKWNEFTTRAREAIASMNILKSSSISRQNNFRDLRRLLTVLASHDNLTKS